MLCASCRVEKSSQKKYLLWLFTLLDVHRLSAAPYPVPEGSVLLTQRKGMAGAGAGRARMASSSPDPAAVSQLALPWERDYFLRSLVRELASVLEEVVGLNEASGFISVVGQRIGLEFNRDYTTALGVSQLTRQQVAAVLVDLKRRIEGDFFVIEQDDEKIVLGNRACPFADKVLGQPAMCMMTSNVFGGIAAENLGYAKVVLQETIAQGHPGCRVMVYRLSQKDSWNCKAIGKPSK
jgi:predicted ArsR family transcriptional regulator